MGPWISVDDRVPGVCDGELQWVSTDILGPRRSLVGRWIPGLGCFISPNGGWRIERVTHWMPMEEPEGPKSNTITLEQAVGLLRRDWADDVWQFSYQVERSNGDRMNARFRAQDSTPDICAESY